MKRLICSFIKNYLRKIIINIIIEDFKQDGRIRYLLKTYMPEKVRGC